VFDFSIDTDQEGDISNVDHEYDERATASRSPTPRRRTTTKHDSFETDLRKNRNATDLNSKSGGFKLSWHWQLVGSVNVTDNGSNSKSVWKIMNHNSTDEIDKNMMAIMNLVHESKIHKIERREIWKTILKHRWDIDILKTSSCLNINQVEEVIYKTSQDLNLTYGWNIWIPEEDLASGTELYSTLQCPRQLVEAAKLAVLFESQLSNHNLKSLVATTMHNVQPRAGDNIKDFTAINMWYQRLDERYNFSLGSIILPLMTSNNLKKLETIDPPFIKEIKAVINDSMSSLFGKECQFYCLLLSFFNHRR
jgi:hypothetical protein